MASETVAIAASDRDTLNRIRQKCENVLVRAAAQYSALEACLRQVVRDCEVAVAENATITGDGAKMREACDYARDMCADAIHLIDADSYILTEHLKSVVAKMNAALAALDEKGGNDGE